MRRRIRVFPIPLFLLVIPIVIPHTGTLRAQPSQAADSTNPCGAPEYRQFDFWIGEWNVMTPNGEVGGRSSIEREYNGCLIVENWAGPTGVPAGTSQNFYDKTDGKWRQNWIDGQASNPLWLEGNLDAGGAMVMTDSDPSANPFNRITWTPNPDGSVRQHWETSTDGGATWSTAFDGLYVPRQGAAGG